MAPILSIRLLGEFSLDLAGTPVTGVRTPRLQSLLAYLLLHRDAPQSRAHLAFQFWPDSTEAQARSNLRTLLHRLRRALPDALPADAPFLDVDDQTVQWHPDAPATVDLASFEQALTQASAADEAGDETTTHQALEQAASLYQGDLLPNCYDDWLLPHRERLRQAHLRALERLIRLLEDRREYDAAITHAQRILRLDPLHEAALLRARPLPPLDDVWLAEVARLLPEILAKNPDLTPPRPMAEDWRRQRLFEALAQAVLGAGQPLLLIIDDLQWCSRVSLEWLHFLLRFDPRAPLLLVGTCRPEELDEDCPLTLTLPTLHRDVQLREIELRPLDEAETATLAGNVAGGVIETAVARRLYDETEGNPLFVVETVRNGLHTSVEQPVTERLPLPPRVQAVLVTRLAQLSVPARQLAEVAATIGRQFSFPVLQKAGDGDEDNLVRGLDELWRRRIVRERGADAYDFSHDKLRETAYTVLSTARRRLLHRRVAQALESVHGLDLDPVSRQVAAHYRRAGLAAQAIPYYLRAGEMAKDVCAQDEAIACFEDGLTLLEMGMRDASQDAWCNQMAARLQEGLGDVLAQLGQPGEARAEYQRALEAADPHDLLAQSRLERKVSATLWPQGEYQLALDALDRAEDALGPQPEEPGTGWTGTQTAWWVEWAQVQNDRGTMEYFAAQVDALAKTVAKLTRTADQTGLPFLRISQWSVRFLLLRRRDRFVMSAEALAEGENVLALIKKLGDPDTTAKAQFGFGLNYLVYGDLDRAEEHIQAALALAEGTGNLVAQTWTLTWLSTLHRKRGQTEATRKYAVRGLRTATAARLLENAGLARGNLAWLAWRQGDLAGAEKQAHTALELWQWSPFVYAFHWTARFPLLAAAVEKDTLPEALDHARAMLDLQQQQLPEPLEAALQAAIRAGDEGAEAAGECLERVIQVAKETGYL